MEMCISPLPHWQRTNLPPALHLYSCMGCMCTTRTGRVYAEQTEPWSPRNSLQTAERGLHGCTDATQQISPTTPSLHSSIMGSQSGRNLPRKGVLRLSALIAAKRVSTKFRAKAVKTVLFLFWINLQEFQGIVFTECNPCWNNARKLLRQAVSCKIVQYRILFHILY